MKQQVIRIHWWEVEENYVDFNDYLEKLQYNPEKENRIKWWMTLKGDLWDSFEVFWPEMPNKRYANYNHWKIMFEKVIPYLNDDCILIWHSLWWAFILKYLNENNFSKKIKKIFLISSAIEDIPWDLIWTFNFDINLKKFKKYEDKTVLFHSIDDDVVPFSHFEKLSKSLTNSEQIILNWRKHFTESTFPELIEYINKIK